MAKLNHVDEEIFNRQLIKKMMHVSNRQRIANQANIILTILDKVQLLENQFKKEVKALEDEHKKELEIKVQTLKKQCKEKTQGLTQKVKELSALLQAANN